MTAVAGVEATDAELVGLAVGGDREAFRILFDRHSPRVAAACRSKLRSQPDVDDAVQEAFFRALANLDQLREPGQFGAWVRSIAVRACMDHHRAARRVIVTDSDTHAERPDSAPLPDEVVEGLERDETIRRLLLQLGERDRQALYMRHINEACVAEVAGSLGLTEGSTRVMLTRARERLRVAAAGLGSFIPWSWRRWFREHVGTAAPALEVRVVAVAVGLAGGFTPPAAEATPPPAEVSGHSDSAPQRAEPTQPSQHGGRPPRAARLPATSRSTSEDSREDQRASGVATPQPEPRVLDRVRNSVTIQREYPNEDESQEVLDLTVISGEDENEISVYGNQITETGQSTAESAEDLLAGSEG